MNRFWLTYDLSNPDVYDSLYKWIARHSEEPEECGGTTITFLYNGDIKDLKANLEKNVKNIENEKIYIIYKKEDGRPVGKFIWGKRNRKNPWDSYLVQDVVGEDL